MSNGSYERFGKLLAALGKIVYDDRRHLESICASLQGWVFDAYEWPKSKDWNEIRFVARHNPAMAAVLANLDLDNKDVTTQQIIAAFPQCFREEAVSGPIALSCIRAMAISSGKFDAADWERKDYHDEYYARFPQSYGVLDKLNMPYHLFATSKEADGYKMHQVSLIPEGVSGDEEQGSIVCVGGVNYVVAENNQNSGVHEIALVSAELIDITC